MLSFSLFFMQFSSILLSCLLGLHIYAQPIMKRSQYTSIYAFGDSYTDNFSLDQFYKQGLHHIDKNSTLSFYPDQGQRYSNGPLWIEYLANQFNASLYDFARSGATSNNSLIFRSTQDVNAQITAYNQSDVIQQSKSDALYCFWIGVNDIDVLFQQYPNNTTERQSILDHIIDSVQSELTRLYDIGAQQILLMGLIPLQELPKYNSTSLEMRDNLRSLVLDYNARLLAIQQRWTKKMIFFDTYQQFYRLFDSDTIARNTKMDCGQGKVCDRYIWWDHLHPTASTHKKISEAILSLTHL
ncbi:GDSL lipase/esterase [Choanephora cucurbitarum]|nr:GDSL lipase/esterase [Choanephora cucurbitarum]